MTMSWLSMIGGGVTAAATLAVGISTSGILGADPTEEAVAPAAGETIYVEQPVIEVSATGAPLAISSADPIVIAILPAPSEPVTTLVPDPSLPALSYEDGGTDVYDEDGEYEEDYEEEYEEDYEEENEEGYEDEYEDEYDDEGPEEGDDD